MVEFLVQSRSNTSPSIPESTSTTQSPPRTCSLYNVFFPSHRNGPTAHVMLSPSHHQANVGRKRTRSDSSTSRASQLHVANADLALPYRPAPVQANSSRRREPLPKILPSPGDIHFKANDAIRILCEIPIQCDVSHVDVEPSVNRLAKNHQYFDGRRFTLMPWRELHNRTQQQQFVDAVKRLPGFSPTPGGFRTLQNETDAKAFIVNVIAPILPILNAFLSGNNQEKLQVQLFSEVQKSETGRRRTDHALMLVDTTEDDKGLRVLKIKQALVIIEAKRHDLIDADDWEEISKAQTRQLSNRQRNMKVILPQVLMYCHYWLCSRVILTDYSDTIAVDVNHRDIPQDNQAVRLSYIDISTLTGQEDVFSYGPRAMISFQVFEALRELGLLDKKLFPYAQGEPKFNGPLHRYLFPERHSSPTPPPPPPASRQPKPQQPLTQPIKPKPRTSMNSKSAGYA